MKIIVNKKFYAVLKQHLRRLSMYSPMMRKVVEENRRKVIVGVWKNGRHKFRYECVCAECGMGCEEYEIDHKVEVSRLVEFLSDNRNVEFDLGQFCEEMLMGESVILCLECHNRKTKGFMRERGNKGRLL